MIAPKRTNRRTCGTTPPDRYLTTKEQRTLERMKAIHERVRALESDSKEA